MASSSINPHVKAARLRNSICGFGYKTWLDTSYTVTELYRQYLCCPYRKCDFFEWVDPWRPAQVEDINSLNGAEEREKLNMWIHMYHKVLSREEGNEEKRRELQRAVKQLEDANNKLKKKMWLIEVGMACVLMFVVAAILA